MRIPLLIEIYSNRIHSDIPMESFYRFYKITRQGFRKAALKLEQRDIMMSQISELVKKYRMTKDRRAGSRSLYYNLDIKTEFKIGVNKFENLLSNYGLNLLPLRVRVVTTRSNFQSWNYNNRCVGLVITGVNQLVVGDLTYLGIGKQRYYFFCLTDVFSSRIVGYHLSERMRKQEAISALKKWISLRGESKIKGCIHHTDGGTQYFSKLYLTKMKSLGLKISVAENCLENGYAEQRNSTIKYHLLPTVRNSRKRLLEKQVEEMIDFYNYERKQDVLGWRSPVELEQDALSNKQLMQLRLYNYESKTASERLGFRRNNADKNLKKEKVPKKV